MSEHGTRAHYQTGCRCLPCCAANAAYAQQQRKAHAPGFVDAGPAAAHLAYLRARGMGVERIAMVSGVSERTIWHLATGTQTTVRRDTAEALLEVPVSPSLGALVDSVKAWRLVRLLRKEGYTDQTIAAAAGQKTLHFGRTRAPWRIVRAIARFYQTHVEEPSDASTPME